MVISWASGTRPRIGGHGPRLSARPTNLCTARPSPPDHLLPEQMPRDDDATREAMSSERPDRHDGDVPQDGLRAHRGRHHPPARPHRGAAGHSGPTVSQTVARMERDGLSSSTGDRHLELTAAGEGKAVRVMRKHRLAERLLTDVIGLEWPYVHEEACRWEHVMSERVEKRLASLLDHPHFDPYGNPIPGSARSARRPRASTFLDGVTSLVVFRGEVGGRRRRAGRGRAHRGAAAGGRRAADAAGRGGRAAAPGDRHRAQPTAP